MKKTLNKLKLVLFCLILPSIAVGQLYYPPNSGNWDTINPQSLGWCTSYLDTLDEFLDKSDTKAFIILKDGKIVYEKYFNGFGADSLWYWASASKSLSAFLMGQAQEEGHLKLSDTVVHVLGKWTNCTKLDEEKITIWHQLTMTSGFDGSDPWFSCLDDTCFNCIAAPGTRWDYHNSPYRRSHDMLTAATNMGLNLFTWNRTATPIGMGGFWLKTGHIEMYYSKARGMARFGLLMLGKGIWDQDTLLGDTNYFKAMIQPSQGLNQSYGYLWWLNGQTSHMLPGSQIVFPGWLVPSAPADMYAAMGKNEQRIYVVPSENLVVVRVGNATGAPQFALSSFDNNLWLHLNKLKCQNISTLEYQQKEWWLSSHSVVDEIPFPESDLNYSIYNQAGQLAIKGKTQKRIIVSRLKTGVHFLIVEGYKPLLFIKE